MNDRHPLASLSLDLDNQWSYMKTHGDAGWEDHPSYLDMLVPRVLDFLAERDLRITFFVVGQDAALPKNAKSLKALANAGHEIGNHSFHHEPWLHLYTPDQVDRELAEAENAIASIAGQRPIGFRGPGFSLSREVLECLKSRDYRYDCSTLPTFIGPFARAYYFAVARLPKEERAKRSMLFGSMKEALRPLKPYRWNLRGGPLLEIPVTTVPVARVPFHLSYILFLAGYSPWLALQYFRTALAMCRICGVQPSLLLHPLDFLGADDVSALAFFPGMAIPAARKLELVARYVDEYRSRFTVVTMAKHAEAIEAAGRLDLVGPRFPEAPAAAQLVADKA
jgi:peptidoglycan/xylan/chitin deacetylase (PgdA/CDA1 family)